MENFNVFAGAFVERIGDRRKDPDWLERAAINPEARFVPVWGDRCMVGGEPPHAVLLTRPQVDDFVDEHNLVFLGLFRNRPTFALAIDGETAQPFKDIGNFESLRAIGTRLPMDEANLIAHARALVLWHASQSYCGKCGSAARPEAGGNMRRCVNAACGAEIFPRTDPAVIVLVHDDDRCLLGRQASWPEHVYSTVAGFVEPGESLEDAVRREVFEETNIRVAGVEYHSSQPWPFPSALMLGFIARASTSDISLNDGELEDARWFTRDELRSDFPKLPFRISIARRLVDHWITLGD
ncbi:MAG: NAD(+) diphosphatase [Gammaproteobacteria bacterium]|nr:NAD(+) diphosphatase [Gammaproteobacteria bacterium]